MSLSEAAASTEKRKSPLIDGVHRTRLPEYGIWAGLKSRCNNPNNPGYVDYGGRGITVCDRWSDFAAFYADMGRRPTPRHSIDRIDNDGDYEPGNCRWATAYEQQANRRTPKPKDDRWTEAEVATLRSMFLAHYRIEEIARVIGRTTGTVRLRSHVLGLRRDSRFTVLCRKHPRLAPILRTQGPDAFLTALADDVAAENDRKFAQKKARTTKKAAVTADIMARQDDRNSKMRALRLAGLSLEEIGKLFGITRERVRQLQSKDFVPEGQARKISATKPENRAVHVNRLIRAWNRASREARVTFMDVAKEDARSDLPLLVERKRK